MKFAFVLTDGLEQFVLTPETDTEKKLVAALTEKSADREMSIHRGGFYECRGGWFRERRRYREIYSGSNLEDDDSAIICLRPAQPETHETTVMVPEPTE